MTQPLPVEQQLKAFRDDFERLRQELAKRIVGHDRTLEAVLIAAIAGGHVLLEGPPGVGKTTLVETLADAVQLAFQRIQFTPDLMPADLLGTHVVMESQQGRRTFEFHKGPIFANLILADHINRGLPKTQSALLEAMEGDEISVSNETVALPQPFFVLATQNPAEMEGNYPLPEPQLDRFFFKLLCPPPTADEMDAILERTTGEEPPPVNPVCDGRRLLEMRAIARRVVIDPALRRAVVGLVAATYPGGPRATDEVKKYVSYGASPRAAQAIVLGAKIRAAAAGRAQVAAEDLRALAAPALRHRLILNFAGQAEGVSTDKIVDALLQHTKQ